MNELIKVENKNGELLVSARELHERLGIETRYNDWFKRMLKYGFEENNDYIPITQSKITTQGNKTTYTDHLLRLDMALCICRYTRNNSKSIELIKYLQEYSNKEIEIRSVNRLEFQFGDMLEKITGFKWEKQYPIDKGKYRLDFYLKDTLIVEYDENHHEYQITKDDERIEYIRDWLATQDGYDDGWRCPVIRVKKGKELEGLNRIIRHLAGFEMFDTQYNYNLEICDYKNKKSNSSR